MTVIASVLEGTFGALIVSVGVALVAGSVVLVHHSRRRRHNVRWRVGQFVDVPSGENAMVAPALPASGSLRPIDPPPSTQSRLTSWLAPETDIAGIEASPTRVALLTLAGSILLGVVVAIVVGSPLGLLVGLIGPFATRWYVTKRVRKTRADFAEQLPDNLDVVSSALRAGHGLVGALSVTVDAADEPSRAELGRALADEQLGVPLDAALHVVAERMQNADLDQVAFVARLQRQAGTNAAEVIDQVSENCRNRSELRRLVHTLTAQGRMARWIVSLLPVGLFLAMYLINREYLRPLWETAGGKAGLILAGIMVIAGSLIIKKIVEIEV